MHFEEFDFRYEWIETILLALETGFERIRDKAKAESWFDGLWQLEYAESIFGIAFVAAQAYILGTVEDVNKIREHNGKNRIDKNNYYSDAPNLLSSGINPILLINSIANYYKHHDEWDKWPNNHTVETLAQVGIVDSTEFPCNVAITILLGDSKINSLNNILTIISEWRKYILSRYG
jgi:hypothetical protein